MNYQEILSFVLVGTLKDKYGSRIKFIHVYVNFNLNLFEDNMTLIKTKQIYLNSNFINFLNMNYRFNKFNILYIGFNACGLIANIEGIINTKYILIGCDCIKYSSNQISFNEIDFTKIAPENNLTMIEMIEIIDENKIGLDLLNDIYKI